jgi:hypothetical protein
MELEDGRMKTSHLLIVALCLVSTSGLAQQPDLNQLWHEAPTLTVNSSLRAIIANMPRSAGARPSTSGYREFDLDPQMLNSILAAVASKRPSQVGFLPFEAPLGGQTTEARGKISIPAPDGALLKFAIEDSNTMSPELAQKHPEIRTFRGLSEEDPHSSLRLEVTPTGLHALVRTQGQSFYVQPVKFDPQYLEKSTRYASFLSERVTQAVPFKCATPPEPKSAAQARPAPIPDIQWGDTFRTYRLAVATTGFYTKAVGGTKSAALAALTQTVDRVNEIYEREFSIHLELIPEEDLLISTDPKVDKLHNDVAETLIVETQALIDRVIGDSNYDIGHMLSTGAGGLAQVGAVRRSGVKAMGVTGTSNPTGAFFDVDFVSHEMGHQFGANHTFNGNKGECGKNRNQPTAYEPGSGSTILSYAGICGSDNVQLHSDAYFHGISIREITDYVSGLGDTDRTLPTGFVMPILKAGSPASLPVRTPFYLGAALQAADPQDTWTFAWEEFDLGPAAGLGAADDGHIPLFRSMTPNANPVRVFAGTLPRLDRSSTFRVTARTVRATKGALLTSGIALHFVPTAGPFAVSKPNGSALKAGPNDIVWQVAHTDQPPINASEVKILLSIDGGASFATVLAEHAPNTGSAQVALDAQTVPVVVRVQSLGNYFFADSPPTAIH